MSNEKIFINKIHGHKETSIRRNIFCGSHKYFFVQTRTHRYGAKPLIDINLKCINFNYFIRNIDNTAGMFINGTYKLLSDGHLSSKEVVTTINTITGAQLGALTKRVS